MTQPASNIKWRVKKSELSDVSKKIAATLCRPERFVLWMRGDLGAGKTTVAGEILRALGLPKETPVLSPTYTFMNEYQTDAGLIAHMDLYRLSNGDEDSVEGFLAGREFAGLIVEWPERVENSPAIIKTHELRLSFADDENVRELELTTY